MQSKRGLPSSYTDAPPEKRLRENLTDLFLTNQLSASRSSLLLADAELAGAQNVSDLSRIATRSGNNKHRDLLRRFAKLSAWPKLYNASVRCFNARTQTIESVDIPVALPHELLDKMAAYSDMQTFTSTERLTPQALTHLGRALRCIPRSGPPVVPLGLWLDGTPCNWDRLASASPIVELQSA